MIKDVFTLRSFGEGLDAVGGFLGTWLVVKLIETAVPAAHAWDLLYVLVVFVWFWWGKWRAFARAIVPLIALALAVVVPTVLLIRWLPLSPMGHDAFEWFAAGCVLTFVVFGLRGGLSAIALNALGVILGIVAALAMARGIAPHAGLLDPRSANTLLGETGLQAALVPCGTYIVGWAIAKDLPERPPEKPMTGKQRAILIGVIAFLLLFWGAIAYAVIHG